MIGKLQYVNFFFVLSLTPHVNMQPLGGRALALSARIFACDSVHRVRTRHSDRQLKESFFWSCDRCASQSPRSPNIQTFKGPAGTGAKGLRFVVMHKQPVQINRLPLCKLLTCNTVHKNSLICPRSLPAQVQVNPLAFANLVTYTVFSVYPENKSGDYTHWRAVKRFTLSWLAWPARTPPSNRFCSYGP